MPGMLAGSVRERKKFINPAYISGWADYTPRNMAADDIVEDPSKCLLSQPEIFEAEGGWATFGLSMGLAGAGAAAVIMGKPGMAVHLGRGQLKAMEWAMIGGAGFLGGFVGKEFGIQTLGDATKYDNHWMAYTFVKSQNRFVGGSILGNIPYY